MAYGSPGALHAKGALAGVAGAKVGRVPGGPRALSMGGYPGKIAKAEVGTGWGTPRDICSEYALGE